MQEKQLFEYAIIGKDRRNTNRRPRRKKCRVSQYLRAIKRTGYNKNTGNSRTDKIKYKKKNGGSVLKF